MTDVDVSPKSEPLLVIVGPTASGKSRLGLEVAEAVGGEIVSADAFAVYRGLDIGTDKAPEELRRMAPHHMIDIIDPDQEYSVAQYEREAGTTPAEQLTTEGRPLTRDQSTISKPASPPSAASEMAST